MKTFDQILFKGTFRSYQQNVLNKMDTYLQDKKIHIVAAPGSGKTTLGIELIRRLKQPALILSPSITIRNQWGKRIKDGFLNDEEEITDYLSHSLKDIRLFTSITYQGLHAAFHHLIDKDTSESEIEDEVYTVDYSDFDLIKEIKNNKIRTICLDEAHHLRSEWYKVLTALLEQFEDEFTIIALTATPPYDSQTLEWERYISLCGDIDEEIFVPELIKQDNLCPHQDYIYFNYPTAEEVSIFEAYSKKAMEAVDSISTHPLLIEWTRTFYRNYTDEIYQLYEHTVEYNVLRQLINEPLVVPKRGLIRILKLKTKSSMIKVENIEKLMNFIIQSPNIFSEDISEMITKTLKNHGVIENQKAQLKMNSALKRRLVSSIGKIKSIGEIAKFESETLGHDLQMLVLTDYIKKEMLSLVGSETEIHVFGAVPIFEVIRRNIDPSIHLAMLTGALIIIPSELENVLLDEANKHHIHFVLDRINDSRFSVVKFKGSLKITTAIITELFERRYIDILVGTKSLLGEGWDSPCVNTLIMASFVGSYMLSNQMRGRAIRIDPMDPNKVASIWHLATVEPYRVITDHLIKYNQFHQQIEEKEIVSQDFETLTRRFKTFLGPSYIDGQIQTGIERISVIQPPYSYQRFSYFNQQTLLYARNRSYVRNQWTEAVLPLLTSEIIDVSDVAKDFFPASLFIYDVLPNSFAAAILFRLASENYTNSGNIFTTLIILIIAVLFGLKPIRTLLHRSSAKRTIHSIAFAIYKTMRKQSMIESHSVLVKISKDIMTNQYHVYLEHASVHEKSMFTTALQEALSAFSNPKYIVIANRGFLDFKIRIYASSYAVPTIFSNQRAIALEYMDCLIEYLGKFELVHTRSNTGFPLLVKANRLSRVNRFGMSVTGKKF